LGNFLDTNRIKIERNGVKGFARAGKVEMISNKDRSTLGIQGEECKPVDKDHSLMVKFISSRDNTYKVVKDWLSKYELDAVQVVARRSL